MSITIWMKNLLWELLVLVSWIKWNNRKRSKPRPWYRSWNKSWLPNSINSKFYWIKMWKWWKSYSSKFWLLFPIWLQLVLFLGSTPIAVEAGTKVMTPSNGNWMKTIAHGLIKSHLSEGAQRCLMKQQMLQLGKVILDKILYNVFTLPLQNTGTRCIRTEQSYYRKPNTRWKYCSTLDIWLQTTHVSKPPIMSKL